MSWMSQSAIRKPRAGKIEHRELVPGADQPARDGAAHVAQSDEADGRHRVIPLRGAGPACVAGQAGLVERI